MVVQAWLRMRHRGCVTEKFHDGVCLLQLSGERGWDLFALHAPDRVRLEQALRWCEEYAQNKAEMLGESETSMVFRGINPRGGTFDVIRANAGTILWPVVYRDGEESYTLLASDRAALQRLVGALGKLGDVRVERFAEVTPRRLEAAMPLADVTADLTPRQLQALALAVRSGYYDSPRATTSEALAAAMGIGRTTYEEHLRKAETRVLRCFAEVLAAHPSLASEGLRGRGRPRGLRARRAPEPSRAPR